MRSVPSSARAAPVTRTLARSRVCLRRSVLRSPRLRPLRCPLPIREEPREHRCTYRRGAGDCPEPTQVSSGRPGHWTAGPRLERSAASLEPGRRPASGGGGDPGVGAGSGGRGRGRARAGPAGGAAGHRAQRRSAGLAGAKRACRHVGHERGRDRPRSPPRTAAGGRAVAARHGASRRAWAGGIVGLGARRVRDRLRARWWRELDGPPVRAGREQHPGRRGCYCGLPPAPRRRRQRA
jgi:hypothetical protein